MMISKTQVQNLLKVYETNMGKNRVGQTESSAPVVKKDDVSISDASRLKQKVMQAVNQAEDIRADKVNELKEKLAAGTYEVSDGEVAEKMISRTIVDRLI